MSSRFDSKIPKTEALVCAFDASNPASVPNQNDTTPATIYDCSSNGNDASVTSGEFSLTVRDGVRCWDNDGSDAGYTITSTSDLTTSDFSVAFWMNPDAQNATYERFFAQGSNSFEITMGNEDTAFGTIRWYDGTWNSSADNVYTGEWNLVVLVYDYGSPPKVYIFPTISGAPTVYTHGSNRSRTRSGNIYFGGDQSGTEIYNGGIGSFYMWKTVLSADNVYTLFTQTKRRYI